MTAKQTYVQAGKRKIPLSNLDKVLYPEDDITKAEIIHYLVEVAPYFLQLSKGRPLSLVRYPDGITGDHFFQKDLPEWAPEWIHTATLGKESRKRYIVADDISTLAWIGNMAGLEIHQMNVREPHFDKPDYIVYDLDPSPGTDFDEIKETAINLGTHLKKFGYEPFFKTSGSRGIHVFTPILPLYKVKECFDVSKILAESFIKQNPNTTIQLSKIKRKGRILIDIYRNRSGQTIISPFSMRAKPSAPVTMPVSEVTLGKLRSSRDFTIKNALKAIRKDNPWEGMFSYAVPLHTDQKTSSRDSSINDSSRLKEYSAKRTFRGSPEPLPEVKTGKGLSFVLHRHNAGRLHYDLRLEENGVLKSWALPKGLPERPGIKRLAVATEDHPLDYLNFQGDIPKGEYGGGRMWVFARGKYEIYKKKKNGFYFRLDSAQLNAEYRMHEMKKGEWLLERVDNPVDDWVIKPPGPMLAEQVKKVPTSDGYTFELKWDGIRAICCYGEDGIKLYSRNGQDITEQFREIAEKPVFQAYNAVFDGEIVCFDKNGKPDFRKVVSRLNSRRTKGAKAFLYLFDLIYLDGKPVNKEPFWKRRMWLEEAIRTSVDPIRLSKEEEDGKALFKAVQENQLEGIMAKKLNATYRPGERSSAWLKIKVRDVTDVFIIGYTVGTNERKKSFGALHLAEWIDDHYVYRGKVGTGFSEKTLKTIRNQLDKLKNRNWKELENKPGKSERDVWVEPELIAEIQYASITSNKTYREPVFKRIK